jgi:hypothetical protein
MTLISIYQWGNRNNMMINDIFHIVVGQNSGSPIPISQKMINIREVKGGTNMDVNDRKEERKRIKDIFKTSLRQRYPGLIGLGESFNALWRDDE